MRYRIVDVVVVDDRLYVGNGDVARWMRRVTGSLYRATVAEALKIKRRGILAQGIVQDGPTRVGRRLVAGSVGSTAKHTKYVLGGTAYQGRRYIYSNAGWRNKALIDRAARSGNARPRPNRSMAMPLTTGAGPAFAYRVHGQRANNFMFTAYNKVQRRHPALHPFGPFTRMR